MFAAVSLMVSFFPTLICGKVVNRIFYPDATSIPKDPDTSAHSGVYVYVSMSCMYVRIAYFCRAMYSCIYSLVCMYVCMKHRMHECTCLLVHFFRTHCVHLHPIDFTHTPPIEVFFR